MKRDYRLNTIVKVVLEVLGRKDKCFDFGSIYLYVILVNIFLKNWFIDIFYFCDRVYKRLFNVIVL